MGDNGFSVVVADLDKYLSTMSLPASDFKSNVGKVDEHAPGFGSLPEGGDLEQRYRALQTYAWSAVSAYAQIMTDYNTAIGQIKQAYHDAEGGVENDADMLPVVKQALANVNSQLDQRALQSQSYQ